MAKYLDINGLQDFATKLTAKYKTIFATKGQVGAPLKAATVSAMTDQSKIYVYTGSESGYVDGNWYYYNGSAWVSGGVYNSTAFNADTTLSVSGDAADSKIVGDYFEDVRTVAIYDEFLANGGKYSITASDLVSGVWNYSTPATNSARARTKYLFPVKTGMTITYTNNTFDSYYGLLPTRTSQNYGELYGWKTDAGGTIIIPGDGYLTFVIRNHSDNSAEVDPAAFDGTVIIESEVGRLNDAKIENSFNLFDGFAHEKSETVNNVTFTWNNHVCTVESDGPASANSANVLIYRENLPSYIKPKETYYFSCKANYTSNTVTIRIVFYDDELNALSNKTYSSNSQDVPVVVPSGSTKWSLSVFVTSGANVGNTIISDIKLLYAKRNKTLETIADHTQSQLNNFNAYDVLEGKLNKINQTVYGVVFDWAGDVCEITRPNTQSYTASFPLLNDVLPSVIVPGETYKVVYETTNDDVYLGVQLSNTDGSIVSETQFYENGHLEIGDFATRWSLTLNVPSATNLETPAVVSKIQIVSTKTNQELTEITEKTKNDVIQFNSYDIFSDYIVKENETIGTITFRWVGDVCLITGEPGTGQNKTIIPRAPLPFGVNPGETYHVKYKTNYDMVVLLFSFFDSEGNENHNHYGFTQNGELTIPDNAAGWKVSIDVTEFSEPPTPVRVSNIHFLPAKTNLELEELSNAFIEDDRRDMFFLNEGSFSIIESDSDIEQGQWSYSFKDNTTNYSSRLRSTWLIPVRKGMQIIYYNQSAGQRLSIQLPALDSYFGVLETPTSSSYIQPIGWKTDRFGIIDITEDGYLTYVLRNHDDPTADIYPWYYDSKATIFTVSSKANALVGFNTNDYFYGLLLKRNETVNGATFTWNGDVCTVTGTLDSSNATSVLIPISDLPEGVAPGNKYYVKFTSTYNHAMLVVNFYSDSSENPVSYYAMLTDDELTIPVGMSITKWEVHLYVFGTWNNDFVISGIHLFDAKTNKELSNELNTLKTAFNKSGDNVSIGDSNDTFVLGGKRLVFNENGTITWVAN